jgi:hypothetical protein
MTPATVLLDRSFLEALVDSEHPDHAEIVDRYRALLDSYECGDIRLRARHDHLRLVEHSSDVVAPVERIHVAEQFRRQARRLQLPFAVPEDTAVTLVVMRRESIERIATLDPVFEQIAVGRD